MIARITTYKMRPEAIDEAMTKLEGLKERILGMPGTLQFINTIDADGNGVVVSLVESAEQAAANQATVAEIWQNFAQYLVEPPAPGQYEVKANWTS